MDMRKSKETCLSESGAFFQQMLSPLQEGPETSAMTTFTANTYVIDTSNGTEIARLIDQSQILARYLGGVFPEPAEDFRLCTTFSILLVVQAAGSSMWPTHIPKLVFWVLTLMPPWFDTLVLGHARKDSRMPCFRLWISLDR